MSSSSDARSPASVKMVFGPFASRPRLTSGMAIGVVAFVLSAFVFPDLEASTRAIVCWDLTCTWLIALTLSHMRTRALWDRKAHVAAHDEGQGVIVAVVTITAAAASLWAIGLESLAKNAHGVAKELRVSLPLVTVALSWFTTQLIFALHYAHVYYAPNKTTPEGDDLIGGLIFPGGQEPDNWNFAHFAVVIGVASQTADIAFTAKRLRRIGTVHSVIHLQHGRARPGDQPPGGLVLRCCPWLATSVRIAIPRYMAALEAG